MGVGSQAGGRGSRADVTGEEATKKKKRKTGAAKKRAKKKRQQASERNAQRGEV